MSTKKRSKQPVQRGRSEPAVAMDEALFDRLVANMKSAKKSKQSGNQWRFGAKPAGWLGLLHLSNGLLKSTTDERGSVIVDARSAEMLHRDLQQLGHKLRAIALGADAKAVFGQQSKKKPDQQQQQLNYAVTFWRARAAGLKEDTAAYMAQCHYPEFEPPTKATVTRYARARRDMAFSILESEGVDVTLLRRLSAARAHRGKPA
ncbi:MAG TPA: hypothetical protein VGM97_11335 [Steroidobacteraceae bacterium]|jgi:hypothetical protein